MMKPKIVADTDAHQPTLAYHPESFELVQLGKKTFPDVVTLLEEVRESLPEDEKHFIKPQSLKDLYNHHVRGFPVLASVEKTTGKIAAVLLITPSDKSDFNPRLANYPDRVKECDTGIVSSVATAPGYKGQMPALLAAAKTFAAKDLVALWAKVSVGNFRSNDRFKEAGFEVAFTRHDPEKAYPVNFYRKNLGGIAPQDLPVFNEGHDPGNVLAFPALKRI